MLILTILLLAAVFLITTVLLLTYEGAGRLGHWIWGPARAPQWTSVANAPIDAALESANLSGDRFLEWLHIPYSVHFRPHSPGGQVNFLTHRLTLGPTQHQATLDALLCVAHESVHVTQGQRWPIHTRIQLLAGVGAFFSAIATGIFLAVGHPHWALGCASLAALGMAYHLPWHLYLETDATQQVPAVLHAFLQDPTNREHPLDPTLIPEIERQITDFTTNTLLHYPAQSTTVVLQNLCFGLFGWGLTFYFVRWMLPHLS
jgi:hypothetical protein